jgi:YlmC/YmxH family sporulation protein
VDLLRYSELIGKEIVDLSEGIRLGAVIGSDLIIDTERGTLEALLIYQRRGLLGSREIRLAWSGIRSMGRDLIVVDMIDAELPQHEPVGAYADQQPLRFPTRYLSPGEIGAMSESFMGKGDSRTVGVVHASRPAKHRVVGIDKPQDVPVSDDAGEALPLELEEESPQELLGRLARGEKREPLSIWRRRRRKEKDAAASE